MKEKCTLLRSPLHLRHGLCQAQTLRAITVHSGRQPLGKPCSEKQGPRALLTSKRHIHLRKYTDTLLLTAEKVA